MHTDEGRYMLHTRLLFSLIFDISFSSSSLLFSDYRLSARLHISSMPPRLPSADTCLLLAIFFFFLSEQPPAQRLAAGCAAIFHRRAEPLSLVTLSLPLSSSFLLYTVDRPQELHVAIRTHETRARPPQAHFSPPKTSHRLPTFLFSSRALHYLLLHFPGFH